LQQISLILQKVTPEPTVFRARFFSSVPDAVVSLDGKPVGKTPEAQVEGLRVGKTYSYSASRPGYRAREGTFTSNGAEVEIRLQLEREGQAGSGRGKLLCSSLPQGAQIWVDGMYSGRDTPVPEQSPLVLPVGKHEVFLLSADRSKRSKPQTVVIAQEGVTRLA